MPSLTVLAGELAGRRYDFEAEVTIGRSRASDVLVEDETISRRHAKLAASADGWTVEDLGSANGTRINGTRIARPSLVRDGDRLTLGQLELVFRLDGVSRNAREAGVSSTTLRAPPAEDTRQPERAALSDSGSLGAELAERMAYASLVGRVELMGLLGGLLERPGVQRTAGEKLLQGLAEAFPLMDDFALIRQVKDGEFELSARYSRVERPALDDGAWLVIATDALSHPDGIVGGHFSDLPMSVNPHQIRALAALPVRRGPKTWGVLGLVSRASSRSLTANDTVYLRAVSLIWARVVEAWGLR